MAKRSAINRRHQQPEHVSEGLPRALEGSAITARLDKVIHEPVRLGILSALAANAALTFRELKDLLKTTDGNLSIHARKLEDAEYVKCSKNFEGRVPQTNFRITPAGRRALEEYIRHMEAIIQATRK